MKYRGTYQPSGSGEPPNNPPVAISSVVNPSDIVQKEPHEMSKRRTGAIWIKEGTNKNKYITITLEKKDEFGREIEEHYLAFRNKWKDKAGSPDFLVYHPKDENKTKTTNEKTTEDI